MWHIKVQWRACRVAVGVLQAQQCVAQLKGVGGRGKSMASAVPTGILHQLIEVAAASSHADDKRHALATMPGLPELVQPCMLYNVCSLLCEHCVDLESTGSQIRLMRLLLKSFFS